MTKQPNRTLPTPLTKSEARTSTGYTLMPTNATGLPRMIRRPELKLIVPISDSSIFEMEQRGELPPLPERKLKVGGNWIVQKPFRGASTRARIFPSVYKGHDLITTDLSGPYKEILLRHKGARRVETDLPAVTTSVEVTYDVQPAEFSVHWDRLGCLETYADTPEKILDAWVNSFSFHTEDDEAGRAGLRTPQIAALHAISAHFAVGTEDERQPDADFAD